jgi:tetratricopeptide (TPR) repeat protein
VARFGLSFRAASLTLLSVGVACVFALCQDASAQQPASTTNSSWTSSITTPIKQGFDKVGSAFSSKPSASARGSTSEDDPVALKGKSKAGPELHVAVAHLYEQAGKPAEAEQQYQAALRQWPNDLPTLLGLARLKDSTGRQDEAIQLYQQAAKLYPRQSSVHNNLGLCYVRQNRLDEAAAAMNAAIQLEPKNPLYRNNIAAILVDQGKEREAFGHLRAVHAPAVAHYNLGYLLNKRGQNQAALQQFSMALQADPSMAVAKRWVDYLNRSTGQVRAPQHPAAGGVRINSPIPQAMRDEGFAVASSPVAPMPQRLPPTSPGEPTLPNPTLPGISYDRPAASPTAPLPPTEVRSAVRPLPRVN